MATGKPPWSQQFQEFAALFHIGTTKSHPPIPEHLSMEAKDFLLKCLQKEPNLRPTALDLLQHPFVTGKYQDPHPVFRNSVMESGNSMATTGLSMRNLQSACSKDLCEMGSVRCSTVYPENLSAGSYRGAVNCDDDMCQIDDKDDFGIRASVNFNSALASTDLNKSFNPMCEPTGDWPCKFDESPEVQRNSMNITSGQATCEAARSIGVLGKGEKDFSFPYGSAAAEDDYEVMKSKIKAFLEEKALDLKKLQTPLYEEFYSTLNASGHPSAVGIANGENFSSLPPKSRSPKRLPSRRLSAVIPSAANIASPQHQKDQISNISSIQDRALQEIQPPQPNDWKELLLDAQKERISPSMSFSDRQRKWKEELDEELERKREIMHQAIVGGKASSPKDQILVQPRERLRLAFTGK